MSVEASRDFSLINDEDVLRKLWQETDDFGKKKEIRQHMYKLREARLRNFYNSGEVSSDIQKTTKSSIQSKTCTGMTHADSLDDHSFISMKTKEIRDSESPTKDSPFRVSVTDQNLKNQGWNIRTSNHKSDDGKTYSTTKVATTSGTDKIPGGEIAYAAKNEQQASVYKDGDENNFVKAVGASSNTTIKQEASGGDQNSSFKSTSTTTTSSSKYVSEQRSSNTDDQVSSKMLTSPQSDCVVSKKIYTENIPQDLKNHPSYVEGKTKITRETKTLPDGSTVTTTKYEIRDGNRTQSSTSSHYSTSEKSNVQASQSQKYQNESKTTHYVSETPGTITTTVTRHIEDAKPVTITNRTVQSNSRVKTSREVVPSATEQSTVTTKTTVVKEIHDSNSEPTITKDVSTKVTILKDSTPEVKENYKTTVVKTIHGTNDSINNKHSAQTIEEKVISNSCQIRNDSKQETTDRFIREEQQDNVNRSDIKIETPNRERRPKSPAKYSVPERTAPIKPGKSELDQKPIPTEGQYDTTYRSEFTSKKVSVEVSPTHDAFARSLRAVSPDRIRKSPSRNSTSPEKNRHFSRFSPDRRSTSPKKTISTETITKHSVDQTKQKTVHEVDSSTLTRRKKTTKSRSRSPSPTSIASDIEFVKNTDIITDLDTNETVVVTKSRPVSLHITKNSRRITERSPTSPLVDKTDNIREVTRTNSLRRLSPNKESSNIKPDRPFKRTDTYEERCCEILGISNETGRRRSSLDRRSSLTKTSPDKSSPSPIHRGSNKLLQSPTDRKSPTKQAPKISEFPSQIRRDSKKEPLEPYPERKSPTKVGPKVSEFPSQIRKESKKEPLEPYPERKSPTKDSSRINEFPSQICRDSKKEPLEPYPERKSPTKVAPKVSEFPSQIRKEPKKEPFEPYPERKSPTKDSSKISEFPAQVRRDSRKEPVEPYPQKLSPTKDAPQISKGPFDKSSPREDFEREILEPYLERISPDKDAPKICEFPSQIRKDTKREPLEPYPQKSKPTDEPCSIAEFPSQIRKDSKKEPLEPYPEKSSPTKDAPKICEFPSQIRKDTKKEPLEPYLQKSKPTDEHSSIAEFPSQIRKDSKKEPLEPYPEKSSPTKDAPKICEFPSQIRKDTKKEPLEPYPQKSKPTDKPSTVSEFPSQIRRDSKKEPLEPYPEKSSPTKDAPKICEFPSQIRKDTRKEPREPYPQKSKPVDESSTISQIKKETQTQIVRNSSDRTVETKETTRKGQINKLTTDTLVIEDNREDFILPQDKDESSSSEDEEPTVEEIICSNKIAELTATPISEPVLTKKFITQLGKDEEKQNTLLTKEENKILNEKVQTTGKTVVNKTVKKDSPKKVVDSFIKTERKETTKTTRTTSPTKKPSINEVKKSSQTTIDIKKPSTVPKNVKTKPKAETKTTLQDIENMNKNKVDNKVHIRTHRTDETVNKNKTSVANTTVTKKTTIKTDIPKRHVVTTTITVSPSKPKPVNKTTVTKTVKNKVQNGKISSDEDYIPDSLKATLTNKKITEDEIAKTIYKVRPTKADVKTMPKRDEKGPKTKPDKCITTKSIIIHNETSDREVIVDLQRSKSSREPTPDRICPLPVSSDDETPRYPDQIAEPDDISIKISKKLNEIYESEDDQTHKKTVIEEIDDETEDVSILTVDKKINKFSDTTETKEKLGPAPKVERPKLEVTEDLESDECLLSVSQKVNKFITTAEQLSTPQDASFRPKSPKCQYYPEDDVKVSDKIAHFITTAKQIVDTEKGPAPKVDRPTFEDIDVNIREDECLLSVSDKVNKFTTKTDTNISLAKIDTVKSKPETRKSPPRKAEPEGRTSPRRSSNQTTDTITRKSPIRKTEREEKTPSRKPSNDTAVKTDHSPQYPQRDSSPKYTDSTPRSSRRPSDDERPKPVLSTTGRLRSFETVKKAKALFENKTDQEILKQKDILSRPSVFEARRKIEFDEKDKNLKSTTLLLNKERSKSPEKEPESCPRRSLSPDDDLPGYMRPLDRSLRPNSPHRESINNLKHSTEKEDEVKEVRETKFGVALKKTDSTKRVNNITATTKTQWTHENITEEQIEKIFELEILEQLLEQVHNYELRRKIRTQIRLVKTLISEGKLEETVRKTVHSIQKTSEYKYSERKSSSEIRRSQSPETIRRSPSPKSKPKSRTSKSPSPRRHKSPEKIEEKKKVTKVFQTQLKKTSQFEKPKESDTTPEWVKQRNLRKVTDSPIVTKKTTSTTTVKKTRTSPIKETKTTNSITSSYGVGPTDESGTPLFGLKALRAQNGIEKTKVQGTVIKSQYYSENGQEPIGEISVTKYSTDPKDLGRDEETKGITSITTTQKFGYKDTPSLKSLQQTRNKKEIEETSTKTNSTLNRRGSVKAITQKFVENAVETSKNEKQPSSYPKAGLILRTSSFKESSSTTSGGDSFESSTVCTASKSSTTRTVKGETFLSNQSKVTGVQDVISRMKSEDIRDGDSAEDIEARGLLNKFLGAQVILSGIESSMETSTKTSSNARQSTKVTTTVAQGGKPVTKTLVFEHPITEEELETVWDEQTLRLLLEQSTDYEERRQIRARLRQVMAEQEACTELVDKASQEQIGTSFEGESQLLPLLQGLLEAPDTEQTADSGTESGEDQRNGLIIEVQNALDKLSSNLRDDANDINPDRRASLLQLVAKLQAGLAASVPLPERRASVHNRFRRRQRSNRHTVGVSSEELADARRLIEEISLNDLNPSKVTVLQKQNSEGSVAQNSKPFKPLKSAVKNAVAKPFSSSNSTISGNSSSVQTPTEASEGLDFLFNEEVDRKPDYTLRSTSLDEASIRRASDESIKSAQQLVKKSIDNLFELEETDEDSTMKAQTNKAKIEEVTVDKAPQILMQQNPIYQKFAQEEKTNRFNSKKLRMKRANTIDIPKPINFYQDEADSDCSLPEDDYHQIRRSNYLALRGPIRVGNNANKNALPKFEPKTDNDKKFLAFINKHNENHEVKPEPSRNSLWAKPETNRGNVWSNKFGNIKTQFEKASNVNPSQNSARQFWKTANDNISSDAAKLKPNPRQIFEEKQTKWNTPQSNIVSGSLKVKAFEPDNDKTIKFVPQPLPVNKFSHAPQSAFKPIPKKVPPPDLQLSRTKPEKDLDSPLYLYSPKPMEPSTKPWVTNPGESRVLSLVASKFENVQVKETIPVKPRKLSKEKLNISFQQTNEKQAAPYIGKSCEQNNIVKQLSGQYDGYSTYSTVKYSLPQNDRTYPTDYDKMDQTQYNSSKNYSPVPKIPEKQMTAFSAHSNPVQYQNHVGPQISQLNDHRKQNAETIVSPTQKHFEANSSPVQDPKLQYQYQEPEYTSTYQYQSNDLQRQPLQSQLSVESVKEYNAISSRVMTGPVSQQATTVRQKSPMNRNEHDMTAALNLRNTLQKISPPQNNTLRSSPVVDPTTPSTSPNLKRNDASPRMSAGPYVVAYNNVSKHRDPPKIISPTNYDQKPIRNISPYSFSYGHREQSPKTISPHSFSYRSKQPLGSSMNYRRGSAPMESLEINDDGEAILTSKFQIPVINVPETGSPRPLDQMNNKAENWNQICLQNQLPLHKPSPRGSPHARTVSKSKSSHALALPKQFEAGMSKDEMSLKRKTMESFLGGSKSPQILKASSDNVNKMEIKTAKRSINRLKTSEKLSICRQSSGLARSRTLPDMLDETNVDTAFEELFKSST